MSEAYDIITRPITPEDVKEHGLTDEEFATAQRILGRDPNYTELGIFSVMWSEHCSYKSSRSHFHLFPTDGPQVLIGPGENAGVVDIGDGWAVCFKMESHNHPSFIEPFQGAATGVGGILRDIFTMGARPIANLNSLRFGAADHAKTRHLVNGVVSGIAFYGNCMGIPTVGGEVCFDPSYNGNILVNAFNLGVVRSDSLFLGAASGVGNPVIYVGSRTGRDGIHGATMASEEFGEGSEEKRPTVQKGDPFIEKLLLEACMEVFQTDAVAGIQDMGAAGLTCSTFEMASRAGNGVDLDLDQIPQRAKNMTAYELLLSESQERMLIVAEKGKEQTVLDIFRKWDLEASVCGVVTDTGRATITWQGKVVADMPAAPLADEAPRYDRPRKRPVWQDDLQMFDTGALPLPEDLGATLVEIVTHPNMASKRWVYRQYDHMVGADTVIAPGADAAVVRIDGTDKGVACVSDCNSRWVYLDPYDGAAMAVLEAARNLSCVGAKPLAITDCLNFGNPEKPEIMGQFVGCIDGIVDACKTLNFPVVSGNVSLYNETQGMAVLPTPAIGGVGLIDDYTTAAAPVFTNEGDTIVLIGETAGHLGQSLFLREIIGQEIGRPPPVDLDAEKKNGDFVRGQIAGGTLSACNDVADGGVLIAVAEMAIKSSIGATIQVPETDTPAHAWLFGEDQGRYVLTTKDAADLLAAADSAGVVAMQIGITGGKELSLLGGAKEMPLSALSDANEGWLPDYMSGE